MGCWFWGKEGSAPPKGTKAPCVPGAKFGGASLGFALQNVSSLDGYRLDLGDVVLTLVERPYPPSQPFPTKVGAHQAYPTSTLLSRSRLVSEQTRSLCM